MKKKLEKGSIADIIHLSLFPNTNCVVCGTEVYSAVSMNRKAIGVELKDSYYKQSILNLKTVDKRFNNRAEQKSLF